MRRLTRKEECVRSVEFLPDGRLMSASGRKSATVWDPTAGEAIRKLWSGAPVFAVAVSPAGRELALAGRESPATDESAIHLFNLDDLKVRGELRWPNTQDTRDNRTRSIWSLTYTGDGEYLIAARRVMGGGNMYDGGDCRWWRRKSPLEQGELNPSPRGYAVGAANTGTRFAVTSEAQLVLFNHPEKQAVATYPFTATWAAAVAFLPDNATAVVGMSSFLMLTDRLTRNGRFQPLKTDVRTIRALAISPDGRTLLVGGSPGRVEVYDLATRLKRTAYDFDVGVVQSLAFAPDGLTFAVGAEKGLILVDVE